MARQGAAASRRVSGQAINPSNVETAITIGVAQLYAAIKKPPGDVPGGFLVCS
jgi:hypothetical protein